MTNINNGTEVRGYVDFHDSDRGFGFVVTPVGRLFFHDSAQRAVEGTPEAPELTDQAGDKPVRWFKRCPNPSKLILRVGQGKKGPKADVWGVIPERTELEELEFRGTLKEYDGGTVRILRYGPQDPWSVLHGILLAAPRIQTGEPEHLHLSVDDRTRGTSAGRKDVSFAPEWLKSFHHHSGGYVLKFYDGDDRIEIYFGLADA